jgi:hypothetical protein
MNYELLFAEGVFPKRDSATVWSAVTPDGVKLG